MATSLSSYWVKFFTAAGFPLDVATKHAVVFSNNRIKPDMLPDLDKPSLKEMGITLMGDMIAILRYAKKVTEEMTCERFLVDTEEPKTSSKPSNNPIIVKKKVISRVSNVGMMNKSISDRKEIKSVASKNSLKSIKPSSSISSSLGIKKKVITPTVRVVTPLKKNTTVELAPKKRKIVDDLDFDSDKNDDNNQNQAQKRLKSSNDDYDSKRFRYVVNKTNDNRDNMVMKKINDQKRTVFDRLGDSSVTSTTNLNDNSTTFNVTGISTDVVKRNSSVFNRLGDKDLKKDVSAGIMKNGNGQQPPQGILKSRAVSDYRSTIVKVTKLNTAGGKLKTGTMHADYEGSKNVSTSVKQLVKSTKAMKLNNIAGVSRKIPINKLASEQLSSLPAKARLGLTGSQKQQKQVTFNKIATVTHIKKPGVFSRLGI